VVAARLSEEPERSVCLLEAGPDHGPLAGGGWPPELVAARVMTDAFDWREGDNHLGAARTIGGSSAVNACAWLRPPDEDVAWAPLGSHFERAEQTLKPRRFAGDELSPWWSAVAAGSAQSGAALRADAMPLSVHGDERWNASFAYLDPARGRANLTVVGDATVDRLLLDGPRASGVRALVDGDVVEIRAGVVVLCAGAYGSPAVLLRSGLGDSLPVGEGLAEHFGVRVRLEPSDELVAALENHFERHDLFLAQGMVCGTRPGASDWDLHLLPMLGPTGAGRVEGPAEKPYSLGLTAMLLRPEWRGQVTLASDDPARIPVVTPVAFEGTDLDAAVEALELARSLLDSPAARAAVERELVPGDEAGRGEAARSFLAATAPSRYFHPTGTCALGSVADEQARVLGFENVYVADASLIPHPVRANTNWTVMAVAEWVSTLV
jgi:choline dehydrogenase-like flavoprotein